MIAAQLVHAAGESSPGNLDSGTYALVVSATDEADLLRIEGELIASGHRYQAIREPDPPWCGALMAIGLAPCPRDQIPKFIRKLPLLR